MIINNTTIKIRQKIIKINILMILEKITLKIEIKIIQIKTTNIIKTIIIFQNNIKIK